VAGQPALNRYQRDRAKFYGLTPPAGVQHGPQTTARRIYGCPCETCHPDYPPGRTRILEERPLTRAERSKRSRQNLYGKPVPAHVKHGLYAYNVYGCHCALCNKAKQVEREKKVNRWRATARGHWVDLPSGITVLHWPPTDSAGWTCPDCGETPP
jgi:hypothetical protein